MVASLPTQNRHPGPAPMSDATKARLFLALACFWPIFILAMFAASAPQLKDVRMRPRELLDKKNEINKDVRFNFRKILDRVDVMGYGPTHPRIAVVIVGDDNHEILSSVGSLFSYVSCCCCCCNSLLWFNTLMFDVI